MSKGKNAVKEKKKVADPGAKKAQSTYQAGKTTVSKTEVSSPNKKK